MEQDSSKAKSEFQIDKSAAHLFHRIGQIAADAHLKEFGKSGLSARQFAVMSVLAQAPNISQTQLVQKTNIDRSTMAEIVARMEDKGLICRIKSESDKRSNILCLSENGHLEYAAALVLAQKIDTSLISNLSEKNQSRLFEILSQILSGDEMVSKKPKPKKDKKQKKHK